MASKKCKEEKNITPFSLYVASEANGHQITGRLSPVLCDGYDYVDVDITPSGKDKYVLHVRLHRQPGIHTNKITAHKGVRGYFSLNLLKKVLPITTLTKLEVVYKLVEPNRRRNRFMFKLRIGKNT